MFGGYQRVPSGPDGCDDYYLPASPVRSAGSESSFSEKTAAASLVDGLSLADVSVQLRAYLRSRVLWLYDVSKCLGGSRVAPLIPSFLRGTSGADQHVNGIATLDGVRGYACFFVFNFHFLFQYTQTSMRGWGVDPTGNTNRGWHQLPFIKLLYGGRAMVTVFFVLSGYVLARKPLMALRSRSFDTMLQSLSSSIFRRGIRLFLPTIISTFCVFLAIRAGLFQRATAIAGDGVTASFVEHHPVYFPTWQEQFWDYHNFVRHYVDFTNWGEWYNLYDPHVWTIPLEYRASVVLFVTLVCLARARTRCRLALLCAFIVFCARWGRFEIVLFLSGMLLAELDIITDTWGTARQGRRSGRNSSGACPPPNSPWASSTSILPTTSTPPPSPTSSASSSIFAAAAPTFSSSSGVERTFVVQTLLLTGLYLLSYPDEFGDWTPGYRTLSAYIPAAYRFGNAYRFWHSVGAVLALYAICNGERAGLRRPFVTPLAQYLGRVSYAFYLVHGPILHSLGFVTMRWLFGCADRYGIEVFEVIPGVYGIKAVESGRMGNVAFVGCLLAGWAFLLVVSIWVADIFWRVVDVPCVKFARWVENKVIGKQ